MKIIVCLKQVPKTTEIKIDPVTGTLNREGAVSIMNPDDKAGLELALSLKEKHGAHISIISMGPIQAKKMLFEALAMGADEAYLLNDRFFAGSDTLATSLILSSFIKTLPYDLIITGRQAIDGDTAQVGPQMGELLNIPHISYASKLEVKDAYFEVTKQFDDRYQVLKAPNKLLITVLGEYFKARTINVNLLMKVVNDENIKMITSADLDIDLSLVGLKGSPTKVKATTNKTINKQSEIFSGSPSEAVSKIITELKKKKLI